MKYTITTLLLLFAHITFAENTYTNPTVGISLTKPESWHFISSAEHAENLKRVKLSDEEFQAQMQKYATMPLVALSKYKEPYDDLNPSFKLNIKPLGNLPAGNPVAILNLILPSFQKIFKDFELATSPEKTKISGLDAAYMKVFYSLEIPDGRIFPTCSELWIIPRGKHFFMIGIGSHRDEKTGKREEMHAILDSLVIDE